MIQKKSKFEILCACVDLVCERGVDLVPTYLEWFPIGCDCATFGEAGKSLFERLSAFTIPEHKCKDQAEFDRAWGAMLRHVAGKGEDIGNILAQMKRHGILLKDHWGEKFPKFSAPSPGLNQAQQTTEEYVDYSFLCPRPLPQSFERALTLAPTPGQREALLWALLAGLGSFCDTVRYNSRGHMMRTHLYYALIAPAASGKSIISTARKLFDTYNRALRERSAIEWKEFKELRKNTPPADRELLEQPISKSFFLPGDTTASALYASIRDNEGSGAIWESEIDTLTRSLKNEMGNFSDALRNNWGSEPITYNRKKDREMLYIEDAHFSVVLAGTEGQIPKFLQSAENGLFSRFAFGSLPLDLNWDDNYEREDVSPIIKELADYFSVVGQELNQARHNVKFTRLQYKWHSTFFSSALPETASLFGAPFSASVKRLGEMVFRVASILTVWERQEKEGMIPFNTECTDDAFINALYLCERSLWESAGVFQLLPDADIKASKRDRERMLVYNSLPSTFTLDDMPLSMGKSSKYRLLDRWLIEGAIHKQGNSYTKAV